jgi:hypothetical protein
MERANAVPFAPRWNGHASGRILCPLTLSSPISAGLVLSCAHSQPELSEMNAANSLDYREFRTRIDRQNNGEIRSGDKPGAWQRLLVCV